jgi:hypothetical protein
MIEPPSCRQYYPGDFLAVRPLSWDERIDKDDDDDYWAESGMLSGVNSRPGDGDDIDNGEGKEDKQGGEKGTMKGMGTKDGKGIGKGKWKGNGKGKGIVKRTPGGGDISCAIALQLHKQMSEEELDKEG